MSRPCSSEGSHAIARVSSKQNQYRVIVTRNLNAHFLEHSTHLPSLEEQHYGKWKEGSNVKREQRYGRQGCALRLRNKSDRSTISYCEPNVTKSVSREVRHVCM
ncbi:hypothetical protein B5X24_HaOG215131 [Helicoverpa armigera]|nr:hypothetical protein B5X24_HaOG215131 [Helicoverpa armigera]